MWQKCVIDISYKELTTDEDKMTDYKLTDYKLTYFDIDGGRAEAIRLAFHIAGLAFDDQRITFAQFAEMRSTTPFNALPVLEINGAQISQSNAMLRFIGKHAGLYPTDDIQALYCDEVLDVLEDLTHQIVKTFGLQGNALIEARKALIDGWMTTYLTGLEKLLTRGGGNYFADNKLTIADLKVFVQVRDLCSGFLDHVPTDIVSQIAPALYEHHVRISKEPSVAAYYAERE